VLIVKDHSAATRSHLSKPIRQDCGNETNVHRKSRIDVLVESFGILAIGLRNNYISAFRFKRLNEIRDAPP
jgi:hypothetical protein